MKSTFTSYITSILAAVMLLGVAGVLLWAQLDRTANNPTNSDNTSSATAQSQTSANTSILSTGWEMQTNAGTGIKFALPEQESYQPVEVDVSIAIANKLKPKQWYVDTLANQPKRTDIFGLRSDSSIQNIYLVYSPERISLASFACGGLCGDQTVISINKDIANTSTLNELIVKLEADQQANADAAGGEIAYINTSQNFLEKWNAQAVYFQIKETGMLDETTYGYYLITTGTDAYSIMIQGETSSDVTQILNSLEFPE